MIVDQIPKEVCRMREVERVVLQVVEQNHLRAEKISVEVSVLSLRDGRFRRLYLLRGTKSELVACRFLLRYVFRSVVQKVRG